MRRALAKSLLCMVLAGAAGAACAQAVSSLKNHDSNAPVDFAADRIELQDRADRAVLTGNVDVVQGDMRLKADRVTIAYNSGARTEVTRMDASGGVNLTTRTETARSQFATYDLRSRIVTMIGGVSVARSGQGETRGNRLVLNMNTGFVTLDGGAVGGRGGRVTGRFTPPARSTPGPAKN